jgi:hypothetical protein
VDHQLREVCVAPADHQRIADRAVAASGGVVVDGSSLVCSPSAVPGSSLAGSASTVDGD